MSGVDSLRRRQGGRLLARAAALAMGLGLQALVYAQAYPARPVSLVVPYAPGATDVEARKLAEIASRHLGQPIVVINRDGAGGAIGTQSVAKAPADGYTLLYAAPAVLTIVPLRGNAPYRYEELLPVARVTASPHVLAARADAPFQSAAELVSYARAHPGKVVFGSSGNGTAVHLAGEALALTAGVQFNHVPHRGLAPAITAALGGFVDIVVGLPVAINPQVEAGKLRAIAQFGASRSPALPNVPTLREAGVDLSLAVDIGVFAPAALPADVLTRLEDAIERAVQSDEFRQFAAKAQSAAAFLRSADYRKVVDSERAVYAKIVPALGLDKP